MNRCHLHVEVGRKLIPDGVDPVLHWQKTSMYYMDVMNGKDGKVLDMPVSENTMELELTFYERTQGVLVLQ